MPERFFITAFLSAAGLTVATAQACSVVGGYRVPTSLQLVESSDVIVLAKVEAGTLHREFGFRTANLVPTALIKGSRLPKKISYEYASISSKRSEVIASDPRNLSDPNPDVFSGACNRQVFEAGMLVLAFLKKNGGAYVVNAPPFSRALEDVPSPNAPWVKAVRIYVRIAALPRVKRANAVAAEQKRLAAMKDPDAKLIIRDLDKARLEMR